LIAVDRKPIVNAVPLAPLRAPRIRVCLLGRCAVFANGLALGAPANVKSRSLLGFLALRAGESLRRERLMTEFWPDAQAHNARNNLKTALSAVRRLFREGGIDPDTVLVADRYDVRWLCPVDVDVHEFERWSRGDGADRTRALALYEAEVLPGDYHAWAIDARAHAAARFEDALRAELAARPSAEIAERLLLLDPFSADAFGALVDEALARGNRREARAVFRRYVEACDELGLVPSRELDERIGAERERDPRAERLRARFDAQLRAAGDDAYDVAELLALEAELDNDDLAALLDWSLQRVVEAVVRLDSLGIVASRRPARFTSPFLCAAAARRGGDGRRHQAIASIAQRLALHERPQAKLRLAQHSLVLGREREAAAAFLEAGRAFAGFAAWANALSAFEDGVAQIEPLATSAVAMDVLRDLHLGRGHVLNELGHFPAAIRAFGAALDLSGGSNAGDVRVRGATYVKVGHAFMRLNNVDAAWMATRQAETCAHQAGDCETELDAANLAARLLCRAMRYEDAIQSASLAYERAIAAGAHRAASTLAQHVAEPLRRLLRFDECLFWTKRQLNAAVLAGLDIEAQAHYAMGAVAYAVNALDTSEARCREALRLLGLIRRRPAPALLPVGLTEWQCHQALAHVAMRCGRIDAALAECEWLVRSPWVFNTATCAAMTLATVVDVWLSTGADADRAAALAFAERVPAAAQGEPAYFLDALTRARLAAIDGPRARAIELLRAAHAATVRAEQLAPDQIHISYEKLAHAARGFDDALAARCAEAARSHRDAVMAAAGGSWFA
jgi:DNA-binding SARP family transcriptional activator